MKHIEIKEANIEDAKSYVEHSERLLATNGLDGFLYSPRVAGSYKANEDDIKAVANRWAKKHSELGFEKPWLVWNDDLVVGHIYFRGINLDSISHRVELGMGIESSFRGQGVGKQLVTRALDWVRGTNFEWIDLVVFAQNTPAINLYKNFGFEEVGKIVDRYRVDGKSVDNVFMVLKLNR